MKKMLFAFASSAMLLGTITSCGGSDDVQEEVNEELKQEITALDSVNTLIESETQDIQEASQNLENLLEEL